MIRKNKIKNKRGAISIFILVIGTILVCSLAILSFSLSTSKIRDSLVGVGLVEKLNSQEEQNYFYSKEGNININEVSNSEANVFSISDVMNYAKEKNIEQRKCSCGENCNLYAESIIKYSSEYKIPDPFLLLSLMMQESSCVVDDSSSSSVGLMQINLIHCGSYELPADKEACRKELISNPNLNIKTGAKILSEYYELYKNGRYNENKEEIPFQGCSGRNIFYRGWEAALRAYNGWGCGTDKTGKKIYEQDSYVEEVIKRYERLRQTGYYSGQMLEGTGNNYIESKTNFFGKETFLFSAEYTRA